jgi:hypothetical protein
MLRFASASYLDRRTVLQGLAVACCLPASMGAGAQTKVITPVLSRNGAVDDFMPDEQDWAGMGYKRIEAGSIKPKTDTQQGAAHRPIVGASRPRSEAPANLSSGSAAIAQPPLAYRRTAGQVGVPAWILYGVALQESVLKFGRLALPYPWTLCVRGQGQRFASYDQTLTALQRHLSQGVTNVDCGAMQVNWHWHKGRLRSLERALDPYSNLAVGAQILTEHQQAQGNWFRTVAMYHAGSINAGNRDRATRYALNVVKHLQRRGVDTRQWFGGVGHA